MFMFGNSKKLLNMINKSVCFWMLYQKDILDILPVRIMGNAFYSKSQDKLTPISMMTLGDFTINQKCSARILEELLGLRSTLVKDIVTKYKKFHEISDFTIEKNYEYCLKNGILRVTLQTFPEVLAELDIPLKIEELTIIQYDINIVTPLLSLTYNRLQMFIKDELETNRIAVISELLEIEESEVCHILTRKNFLLSLNLNQLSNNVKLLTDNGITKDEITKDLWVLRYSTNVIKERLDMAKKNNIDIFKTWMVRAQQEIFERYIKRRSDNKLILRDSSLTHYLSEKLQCSEEIAKYVIYKNPVLQNKSLKKINEMMDCLFEWGFKPIHICQIPRILLHSVKTTRNRLKELEVRGLHLDSLYILTKSQREFMQYCESLTKTSKNKLKNT